MFTKIAEIKQNPSFIIPSSNEVFLKPRENEKKKKKLKEKKKKIGK